VFLSRDGDVNVITAIRPHYTVVQKNKTPNYYLYLRHILSDFHNSFTGTLSSKFAKIWTIVWFLFFLDHRV